MTCRLTARALAGVSHLIRTVRPRILISAP
jgi:hypothetical protein